MISKLKISQWETFYRLFRRMLREDFPTLPRDSRKYFLEEHYSSKKLKKAFLRKWFRFYLAKKEKKIIGFLIAEDQPGGISLLDWIAVVPKFRGQGIGKKLIETWEKDSKKMKIHKLDTMTYNRNNISFYKKMGFELEGVRRGDQWGKNRYLLGKIIGSYD